MWLNTVFLDCVSMPCSSYNVSSSIVCSVRGSQLAHDCELSAQCTTCSTKETVLISSLTACRLVTRGTVQWFTHIDADHDGYLTTPDLQRAFSKGGLHYSLQTVAGFLRCAVTNSVG